MTIHLMELQHFKFKTSPFAVIMYNGMAYSSKIQKKSWVSNQDLVQESKKSIFVWLGLESPHRPTSPNCELILYV